MSIEEKREALNKSKTYHDENADQIRFDANIPKTVIFPANWNEMLDYKNREFDDQKNPGEKKSVTYTIYKVHNPNSQDAKKLRILEASASLNSEISAFLEMALESGWNGASIAKITKQVKGSSNFATWSVRGDKIEDQQLRELKIIE